MRVLVCGGRHYSNRQFVYRMLDLVHSRKPITAVIEGGSRGADALARDWARELHIKVDTHPADWERYGHGAGPRRNIRMLEVGQPDVVIAFPGNGGTDGMVKLAKDAGVPVLWFEEDGV